MVEGDMKKMKEKLKEKKKRWKEKEIKNKILKIRKVKHWVIEKKERIWKK